MLAMAEAVFGMFYVTLLIARLVSLYSFKAPVEAVHIEEMQTTKNRPRESQTIRNNLDGIGERRPLTFCGMPGLPGNGVQTRVQYPDVIRVPARQEAPISGR
jgi:hypothetical protein